MANAFDLIEKLKKIDRSEYEDGALEQIDGWVKQIEELEAVRVFSTNFVVQDLITRYTGEIKRIEGVLTTKRNMPELERENLLDKKALYEDFISSFDADRQLEEIARNVESL